MNRKSIEKSAYTAEQRTVTFTDDQLRGIFMLIQDVDPCTITLRMESIAQVLINNKDEITNDVPDDFYFLRMFRDAVTVIYPALEQVYKNVKQPK